MKSVINAYQKILTSYEFAPSGSFSENFAQARFHKKMEKPSNERKKERSAKCWTDFKTFDESLPDIRLPPGVWYKARLFLHELVRNFKLGDVDLPSGSEFYPTFGRNSTESKLARSRWSVTRDAFDDFAKIVYHHKALKRAFRYRYKSWFRKRGFDLTPRQANNLLYRRLVLDGGGSSYDIFVWKLSRIVSFVNGSRFSTIPKNNINDRPINLEPFGNLVVQRAIGNGIRTILKRIGVDLNTLADFHRKRIQDKTVSTIDLSNASDSVSLALCKFLFPSPFYRRLERARSPLLLGPDRNFHVTKKVSSMGNGFTFELMSLILNALGRVYDPSSSVYGDDIIIKSVHAHEFIKAITAVGFVVNIDKTFIDSPFRESCGGNYHDDDGYIDSYDFWYPENEGDCVVIHNKAYALSLVYPSFKDLYHRLSRLVPLRFKSGIQPDLNRARALLDKRSLRDDLQLSSVFWTKRKGVGHVSNSSHIRDHLTLIRNAYQNEGISSCRGFVFVEELASETRKVLSVRRHWGKYEMYLQSCRISKDNLTDYGRWKEVEFITWDNYYVKF